MAAPRPCKWRAVPPHKQWLEGRPDPRSAATDHKSTSPCVRRALRWRIQPPFPKKRCPRLGGTGLPPDSAARPTRIVRNHPESRHSAAFDTHLSGSRFAKRPMCPGHFHQVVPTASSHAEEGPRLGSPVGYHRRPRVGDSELLKLPLRPEACSTSPNNVPKHKQVEHSHFCRETCIAPNGM